MVLQINLKIFRKKPQELIVTIQHANQNAKFLVTNIWLIWYLISKMPLSFYTHF